jgi:FKBP-type peptidyl-prolyl cis-trans isomerase SlyD
MSSRALIRFHYHLKGPSGDVVDSSEGGEPIRFVEGYDQVIPGLEQALLGRAAGERTTAMIPPEEAYGQHLESLVQVADVSQFDGITELREGMTFQTGSGDEARVVKVVGIQGSRVVVDTNHPLAGLTLSFDLQVVESRAATAEEISEVEG